MKIATAFAVSPLWLLTGEGEIFRQEEEYKPEPEMEFPDDPLQGMAYLDAIMNMLIDKGVINREDIPPLLTGVKRVDYSDQMNADTRRMLEAQLAAARKEAARLEAHLEALIASERDDEVRSEDATYEPGDSMSLPVAGLIAAGPPLDLDSWPSEWRRVAVRRGELPGSHYLCEVRGTSMVDAGIADGDVVLVHRAQGAEPGQIVVAYVAGEGVTLKLLHRKLEGNLELVWQDGSGRSVAVDGKDVFIQGVFVRVV